MRRRRGPASLGMTSHDVVDDVVMTECDYAAEKLRLELSRDDAVPTTRLRPPPPPGAAGVDQYHVCAYSGGPPAADVDLVTPIYCPSSRRLAHAVRSTDYVFSAASSRFAAGGGGSGDSPLGRGACGVQLAYETPASGPPTRQTTIDLKPAHDVTELAQRRALVSFAVNTST